MCAWTGPFVTRVDISTKSYSRKYLINTAAVYETTVTNPNHIVLILSLSLSQAYQILQKWQAQLFATGVVAGGSDGRDYVVESALIV